MRRINKNYQNAPACLTSAESITNITHCANNNSVESYDSNIYGAEEVRQALDDLYHGKCGYCETKIGPVSTPHIEHYRPLGRITSVRTPGYYWLGYEWSNLFIACPACNNKKRTKFPLNSGQHVSHPITGNGIFDSSACLITNIHYSNEEPLILNPESVNVDPKDHLAIDEFGELFSVNNSPFGETTIREVGLNRADLIVYRQGCINRIISRLEFVLFKRYDEVEQLSDYAFKRDLKPIFEDLVFGTDPTSEYTLLYETVVENFEEYILEELEPEYREELLNEYLEFLSI